MRIKITLVSCSFDIYVKCRNLLLNRVASRANAYELFIVLIRGRTCHLIKLKPNYFLEKSSYALYRIMCFRDRVEFMFLLL